MSNKKILIIDPSPLYREGIKHIFVEDKIKPTFVEASRTSEIIKYANNNTRIDLIIIDEKSFHSKHRSFLQTLISKDNTRTLILCNDIDTKIIRISQHAGAQAIASKADSMDTLRCVIQDILSGKEYWPQPPCSNSVRPSIKNNTIKIQKGLPYLTDRQKEVLQYIVAGMLNKQIAYHLGVQENTVKAHVSQILHKFQINSRTQLVVGVLNSSSPNNWH